MKDVNCTLCRICERMVDGRQGLKEHVVDEHNMTHEQYKTFIAKLRKEGRIPELPPSKVRVVDPSFR